ncbi:MAG: hypothetical protein SO066_01305 [Proteus mirabilis]|nr:hypothetical protein [Proteus mirabilis]
MNQTVKVSDVFKVSRVLPLNYTQRSHVDDVFIDTIAGDNHIIIYGSSKQGKTSLHKYHLLPDDSINISCQNNWTITDLQLSILKKIGFQPISNTSNTSDNGLKISVKFPFVKVGGEFKDSETENRKAWEINPSDVNDVIDIINKVEFDKYIVLEDFHYLPVKTQIDFSIVLKAYHELSSISFIIVGVWLENDRLTVYNGDLLGRVNSVNADEWKDEDLHKLIEKSESLLNIKFNLNFKNTLIKECNGNVFLVQEVCRSVCEKNNIFNTLSSPIEIGQNNSVKDEIKEKLCHQNSRYYKFISEFSKGFGSTKLDLYKWILKIILTIDKETLLNSLYINILRDEIKKEHPKSSEITRSKLHQFLKKSIELQSRVGIQPIIFEYDENKKRIKIVDKYFILWRENNNKEDLLEQMGSNDDDE